MFNQHQVGPPLTLAERLEQLNSNLESLGDQLKEAIAKTIGTTVAEAVRDAVRGLLGEQEIPESYNSNDWRDDRRSWHEIDNDPWMDQDRFEEDYQRRHSITNQTTNKRLRNAIGAAVQTSVWWLKQQKTKRPVLTTSMVALAAGVTAFFYGPAVAAGVGLLASVAGLVLTAESASSAIESLVGIAAD